MKSTVRIKFNELYSGYGYWDGSATVKGSLTTILRSLNHDQRPSLKQCQQDEPEALKYVDTRYWSLGRAHGECLLFLDMSAGCACTRDCCGHLYSETYEIYRLASNLYTVILRTSYNV